MQQKKSSTIDYIGKSQTSWCDEEAIKHTGKTWVGWIFKLSNQDKKTFPPIKRWFAKNGACISKPSKDACITFKGTVQIFTGITQERILGEV